jgi:hypothetical protein
MVANGVGTDPQTFVWGDMIRVILKAANPAKGLTMDEVMQCVECLKPLEAAMEAGEDHVTFTETQYALVLSKLNEFPFGLASTELAEFGLAIRNAEEII